LQMKKSLIIIISLLNIFVFAQKKDGFVQFKYPDGTIASEG